MFNTIHLTNMLRSEVEGIPETSLPLDAFPDRIQAVSYTHLRARTGYRRLSSILPDTKISMWNILRLLFFLLLLLQ